MTWPWNWPPSYKPGFLDTDTPIPDIHTSSCRLGHEIMGSHKAVPSVLKCGDAVQWHRAFVKPTRDVTLITELVKLNIRPALKHLKGKTKIKQKKEAYGRPNEDGVVIGRSDHSVALRYSAFVIHAMSSFLMDTQEPESTSTSENVFVISPQVKAHHIMRSNLLTSTLYEANAAQDFATPQVVESITSWRSILLTLLDLVRFACNQLLLELGPPGSLLHAPLLGENQFLAIYPQVTLTAPQFEFVWNTYIQLLVYDPFDGSTVQLGGNRVIRDFAISQIYQLLREYGVLPGELRGRQVLADDVSHIQPPAPDTAKPIDAQEVMAPAGSGTPRKLLCPEEGCRATFGRQQELNRHTIGVHSLPHKCPFCTTYSWSRPDKIKDHLKTKHQDEHQVLDEIRAKCGRDLVAYLLDTFPEVVQNIQ
ncbi:hypothetical protein H4582DRAFT_2067760 [Lactarius indigo]|nr:hypothetical protein H4582DRAFT_2067760 [Lactarius indigo]